MPGIILTFRRNFAGITGGRQSVSEITLDQFQKVMAVNSSGVLLSTKFELRQMMKQSSVEVYVLP
jgi:NAD(P)-dependent dehydrogenase (short-subunit alcohol dehydrogenase family)